MIDLFVTAILDIVVMTLTYDRIFVLLFIWPDHHVLFSLLEVRVVRPAAKAFLMLMIILLL